MKQNSRIAVLRRGRGHKRAKTRLRVLGWIMLLLGAYFLLKKLAPEQVTLIEGLVAAFLERLGGKLFPEQD